MPTEKAHPALHELLERLRGIYEALSNFHPNNTRPPILDSSLSLSEGDDDSHPSHQDHIPGLKKLKESLKLDLDGLHKVSRYSVPQGIAELNHRSVVSRRPQLCEPPSAFDERPVLDFSLA